MSDKRFLPVEAHFVPVDGGSIAVFRFGPSGERPVLLIHGVTSSNRAFQLLAQELIERGFSPFAVDLRGRGDSNKLPGPFGMERHAHDMAAICEHFGWETVDVYGHSMGAFVAVAFLGLHPEFDARIVLIDGGIPLPLPPGMTVAQVLPLVLGPALARLAMTFTSTDSYRDYWKEQPAFVRGWSDALDEYVEYDLRGNGSEFHPSTQSRAVEEDSRDLFESELISSTLKNLKQEVLFIRAERGLQNEPSGLYPTAVLDYVLPQYPKLKLIKIDDVNHYDMLLESSGARKVAQAIFGG
jgi:pimeloyl-ACP methyl ester carboxylesterase